MTEASGRKVPDPITLEAAATFGIDPDGLVSLGAFVSEVWAGRGPDGAVVLKVMDSGHRTLAQAQAEVAWQRALRRSGVSVSEPLASLGGTYVEAVGRPERLAVAYRRAPGRHLDPGAWSDADFRTHGELVGSLQVHARSWRMPAGLERPDWLGYATLDRAPVVLRDDPETVAAVAEVAERVRVHVPTPDDHVGVIHADLHAANVLVDDAGRLTAIDFDDMVVGPYLYDLAMPLYYAVATRRGEEPADVADAFLGPYLEGFDAVAPRPPGDAEAMAALLAMRQADLTVAVHIEIPEERWDDQLRATVARLRERTVARHEVVPVEVLRRYFG